MTNFIKTPKQISSSTFNSTSKPQPTYPIQHDNPSNQIDQIQSKSSHESFSIGDRVQCSNSMIGICRFIGTIQSKPGVWVGIDLSNQQDLPPNPWHGKGKNSGSVDGTSYFQCPPLCGIFFPFSKVFPLQPEASSSSISVKISQTQVNHESTEPSSASFSSSSATTFISSSPIFHSQSDNVSTHQKTLITLSPNHSTPRPKNQPSFNSARERPLPTRVPSLPLIPDNQNHIPTKKPSLVHKNSSVKLNPSSRTLNSVFDHVPSQLTPSDPLNGKSLNPPNLSYNQQTLKNSLSKSTNQMKRTSTYHPPPRPTSRTSHKRAESVNGHHLLTDTPDWARSSQGQRPKSRLSLVSTPELRPRQDQLQSSNENRIALTQLPILQNENAQLQTQIVTLQKQLEEIQLNASESDQQYLEKCRTLELEIVKSKEVLNQKEAARLVELEEIKKELDQKSQSEINSLREEISNLKESLQNNQQSLNDQVSKFDRERVELHNQLHQLRSAGQSLCGVYEGKISNLEESRLSQVHESKLISEELKLTKLALEELQEKARLHPTDNSTNNSITVNSALEAVQIDNERLKADLKHAKERLSEVQDEAYQLKQELENEREVHEEQSQLREKILQQHLLSLKDSKDDNSKLQNEKDSLEFKLSQVEARLKETLETMEQERAELEGLRAEVLVSLDHHHSSKLPDSKDGENFDTSTILNPSTTSFIPPEPTISLNFAQTELESQLQQKQSRIEFLESELVRHTSSGQGKSNAQINNDLMDSNAVMDQEKMLVIQKYQRLLLIKDEENLKLINRLDELEGELENNSKSRSILSPSRGPLLHRFQSSPKLKHHASTQSLRTSKSFHGSSRVSPNFSPSQNKNSEEVDATKELAKVTQQLVGLKLIARQSNDERTMSEKANQKLKETIEDLKQSNRTLEQKLVQLIAAYSNGDKTVQKLKLDTMQQNRMNSFQEFGMEIENALVDIGNNLNTPDENRPNSHSGEVIIGDYKRVQKLECEIDQLKDQLLHLEQKHSRRVEAVQNEVIELESIIETKIFQEEKLESEIEELKQVIEGLKQTPMNGSTPRLEVGLLKSNSKYSRRRTGSPDYQSQLISPNNTNRWSNFRRASSIDHLRNGRSMSNGFETGHADEKSLNRLQEEQEEDEDRGYVVKEQSNSYDQDEKSFRTDSRTKIIVTDNDSSYSTRRYPKRYEAKDENKHTMSNSPSSRSPVSPSPHPHYLDYNPSSPLPPTEACELCDGVDHQLATCPIFSGRSGY